MKIATRAEIEIPRPHEAVFDFATACDTFPRILHPLGPVPGIAKAWMMDGAIPRTGARRNIEMTDGSVIEEVLVSWDRPSRHRYQWLNRPRPPFSWLVRKGEGDWTFTPAGGGTRIVWVYTFELTSPLAYPLAMGVVSLFRRWMSRGLAELRAAMVR